MTAWFSLATEHRPQATRLSKEPRVLVVTVLADRDAQVSACPELYDVTLVLAARRQVLQSQGSTWMLGHEDVSCGLFHVTPG